MKIIEKQQIEQEFIKAVKCDVCGKEYSCIGTKDVFELQEMVSIKHRCGFGSIFGDGNIINTDVCQHCFKKIFDKFNIKY